MSPKEVLSRHPAALAIAGAVVGFVVIRNPAVVGADAHAHRPGQRARPPADAPAARRRRRSLRERVAPRRDPVCRISTSRASTSSSSSPSAPTSCSSSHPDGTDPPREPGRGAAAGVPRRASCMARELPRAGPPRRPRPRSSRSWPSCRRSERLSLSLPLRRRVSPLHHVEACDARRERHPLPHGLGRGLGAYGEAAPGHRAAAPDTVRQRGPEHHHRGPERRHPARQSDDRPRCSATRTKSSSVEPVEILLPRSLRGAAREEA